MALTGYYVNGKWVNKTEKPAASAPAPAPAPTPAQSSTSSKTSSSSSKNNTSSSAANQGRELTGYYVNGVWVNKTPVAAPEQNTQATSASGEMREATGAEKFGMTPAGEFVAGLTSQPGQQNLMTAPPAYTAGALAGYIGSLASLNAVGGAIEAFLTKTAAAEAAKIGTTGLITKTAEGVITSSGTAGTFATNPVATAQTASWLSKLVTTAKNPTLIVGGIMAAIGTYPFAGFIKEEALQTLSFATTSALKNGDFDGAQAALDQQKEILNTDTWDKLKGQIPFVNVLDNLNKFYEAANLKVAVDEKVIQDLRTSTAAGQTAEQTQQKTQEERDAQEKAMIDYYNEQQKKYKEWQRQAEIEARNEDAAFWAEQAARQRQLEEEDRKAIADFWEEYRRRQQEIADANRPSKLNFGLLR